MWSQSFRHDDFQGELAGGMGHAKLALVRAIAVIQITFKKRIDQAKALNWQNLRLARCET
jgi:hypothetical protein